ncbi:MAG: type II toxin-antitoxin system VapC family toxin [Fimbriimonas sp.]
MIVDTSALVAILRHEEDGYRYAQALDDSPINRISAVSFVEAAMLIDRDGSPISSRKFDELMLDANLVIEPVTAEQAQIAREAWRDFGRGSGHKAQLNFGDLFTYALAKQRREPLLFKGGDFGLTDVKVALNLSR